MPTAIERAQERERRKLVAAGIDPDSGGLLGNNPDGDPDGDPDDGDPAANRRPPANGDQTAEEIEELRQQLAERERQLAALQGRVAPSQQQADEFRTLWQESERQRQIREREQQEQIEALQAQLDASRPAFDINSILTEEDRATFDQSTIDLVVRVADGIAKARVPKIDPRAETLKVLQEREQQRVDDYRRRVLTDQTRNLHKLSELSYNPEFQSWAREEDNDMESVVNSLLNAKSTEEVDRFAKIVDRRIAKFKERTKQPTDARTSLGNGMRRNPAPKLTDAEVQEKLAKAKVLARSRNPADRAKAQQILDELK